ncbi:uncharacterized protein VTP21DRAFT_3637 [Calcarisporiella thermophila]|uniref:uncharacterized protein n=1 Tax=Calcarisporiella thermophila TaxID=911321 RepID=UPI00374259ED
MSSAFGDIRYRKTGYSLVDPVSDPIQHEDDSIKEKRRSTPSGFLGLNGASTERSESKYGKMRVSEKTTHAQQWKIIAGILVIALFVRLYWISHPESVVFDEVHFGGFASKYIKARFFMDVHPPLAKLLIAAVAKIAGFDGNFDFKEIGLDYLEPKVPYVAIRLLPAVMGVALVPIAYLTIKYSGHSTAAAMLAALLVTFENALTTQSRLILLDSPLIFFTGATILMPFTKLWWFWLAMTGVGLGLTASCKWVGLFTIATIGVSTIKNLWELWGDLKIEMPVFIKHFIARAICLIIIPIIVYMLMFAIHFHVLPNSGDGDGFMSSEFQQTLAGHHLEPQPIDIAYGSKLNIRHLNTHGGYLHSHSHNYPGGSKQQQITLYPHKDENNIWVIHPQTTPAKPYNESDLQWVKNGDIVRLEHIMTNKRLHSHDVRPPITDVDYQNEVSGYGFPNFDGDSNDFWRLEITEHDSSDPTAKDRLRTINSKFRLVHVNQGCHLFSHPVKLPDWGFEQQEVTCIKSGKYANTVWFVESNEHPLRNPPPTAPKVNYRKPGFFKKFIELNKVMWNTNKGLTDSHPYDSRPPSWPVLRRGISFWGKNQQQVYLLGNPFVWWCSTVAVLAYSMIKGVLTLVEKRGYKNNFGGLREFYDSNAGFWFVAWSLHYFPFYLMARQLFLHHYLPALYFAILLFCVGFDLAVRRLSPRQRLGVTLAIVLIAVLVFRLFSPITYGLSWTRAQCERTKWMSTWDYDCNNLPETLPVGAPETTAPTAPEVSPAGDEKKDAEAGASPEVNAKAGDQFEVEQAEADMEDVD